MEIINIFIVLSFVLSSLSVIILKIVIRCIRKIVRNINFGTSMIFAYDVGK